MASEPDSPATQLDGRDLTDRQREILALIARGYTNADIATHYGMSLDGAKWHVSEIIAKLGLSSRDEAAEWWRGRQGLRPRLRRFAGRLSLLPLPRVAAIGTATLAGSGVLVVAVFALTMNDDGSPSALPTQETATPTRTEPPIAATPDGTSSAPPAAAPRTPISEPVRREISPGGSVTTEPGVVFLDSTTGGGVVWELPPGAMVGHVSPSGRYIVYRQTFSGSGLDPQRMVLDTNSGDTTEVAGQVTFSPDDRHAVVATEDATAIVRLPSFQQITEMGRSDRSGEGPETAVGAEWAPNGEFVGFVDGMQLRIAGLNGMEREARLPMESAALLRPISLGWSPDSQRLAVASGFGLRVFEREGGTVVASNVSGSLAGSNVRWGPDGRYVALYAVQGAPDSPMRVEGYLRVVEADTGDEILRVHGVGNCVNDYWMPHQAAIRADGQMVQIPSGEVVDAAGSGSSDRRLAGDEGVPYLEEDGRRLAAVEINVSAAAQLHGEELRRVTSDGRGFILLGRGGQGICLHYRPDTVSVDRPPLPTPIPTPSS